MVECLTEELNGHDDANIPCNIFISEIRSYHDHPEWAKWVLTADVFMPRKGLWDGAYKYIASTKEELLELVKKHILPSYKIAFDAVTAMSEGRRDSFYYWTEKAK